MIATEGDAIAFPQIPNLCISERDHTAYSKSDLNAIAFELPQVVSQWIQDEKSCM
ncbi:hypothetical protein NDI37_00460 [Funiculus sociatus GB2-A5]|uniref:Uncharacterized protein n=1 Tax=Funiculus sociatus GB2-A5 TaxID=2933946 RepID=A0ABV0JHP3_9CYAN|nr:MULTISPECIES: hypothetical protein [unclassified Trichocoleus]MBD1904450.1 hypothetical protein [Trichocoleus sp. FACHB-832]MBD2064381.1 hypothetical protein [Trichocoleus sp. FACHB-6]